MISGPNPVACESLGRRPSNPDYRAINRLLAKERLPIRSNDERNNSIPHCIDRISSLRPRAHLRISQLQTTHRRRIGGPESDERCCIQSWRVQPFLWRILPRLRAVLHGFHVVPSNTLLAPRCTGRGSSASNRRYRMVAVRRSSSWCCTFRQIFWFAASSLFRRIDSPPGLGFISAHPCSVKHNANQSFTHPR